MLENILFVCLFLFLVVVVDFSIILARQNSFKIAGVSEWRVIYILLIKLA